jgi:hypothetical protein
MNFEKKDDFYMTLELTHEGKDRYKVKLPSPLYIQPYEKISASLCDISYVTENVCEEFKNAARARFQIAIPEFTSRSSNEGFAGGIQRSELQFITCELENAEYTAQTLVDTLNLRSNSLANTSIFSSAIVIDPSNFFPISTLTRLIS